MNGIYEQGDLILEAGKSGLAYRVQQGVVKLVFPSGEYAGLAITGDLLGCEAMLLGTYTFSAYALTACAVIAWNEEKLVPDVGLFASLFSKVQNRAASLLAIRGGPASGRVVGLMKLLSDRSGTVRLPSRQEIAEITDLRIETISRVIKGLETDGCITPVKKVGLQYPRVYRLA